MKKESFKMITLTKRLRGDPESSSSSPSSSSASTAASPRPSSSAPSRPGPSLRASIRDKLLVKEVQEMELNLPAGSKVKFDDPNALHCFTLTLVPDDGHWSGGKFRFLVTVPEDYNLSPPAVKCLTRLWHPNINETGEVCLSILRLNTLDGGMGWTPTRRLRDVIWGLNSLFSDLLYFDDPLNLEAADHYARDKQGFKAKVREWVNRYAKK